VGTLDQFDAGSGDLVGSVDLPGISNPASDGTTVYGRIYGGLVRLDGASGTWEPVIAEGTCCATSGPTSTSSPPP